MLVGWSRVVAEADTAFGGTVRPKPGAVSATLTRNQGCGPPVKPLLRIAPIPIVTTPTSSSRATVISARARQRHQPVAS